MNPDLQQLANALVRLAWRLGLGWLVGRRLLLLTTVGRSSGRLHRVPVDFVFRGGTFYVRSTAGEATDWCRNLAAQPVCTTQTWPGPKAARARRITDPDELADVALLLGRERLEPGTWVALEPTAQKAPLMLEPDLIWAWPVAAALWLLGRRARRSRGTAPLR